MKKMVLMITVLTMLVTGIMCQPVLAKEKTEKKLLLKQVVRYTPNFKTGKWEKDERRDYTYQKKYPKTVHIYEYGAKLKSTRKRSYTFKKDLPKKMTEVFQGTKLVYKYNSDGTVSSIKSPKGAKGEKAAIHYIYGVKNYFTVKYSDFARPAAEGDTTYDDFSEEIDNVRVKTWNGGLLKKTINRGLYANYSTLDQKEWLPFNGTYSVDYDEDGIAKLTSAKFRAVMPSGKQDKFEVKRKNGKIVSITKYTYAYADNSKDSANSGSKKVSGAKGKWEKDAKYVFKYTNTKVDPVRFAAMINDHIMDGGTNYYVYNWC